MDTDAVTGLSLLVKQPSENRLYDIKFVQELRTGDTISTVISVVAVAQGEVIEVTPLAIADSPAHSDTIVQPRISGGTHGERYKVTAKITTTGGDTLEVDTILEVKDL